VNRIALGLIGVALAALVCSALIPVPKPTPNFSRIRGTTESASAASVGAPFRETRWYELVPKGWDPYKQLRELKQNLTNLSDADARATTLLAKMRDVWDNAPTNSAMNGIAVRIPGYIVPIEQSKGYTSGSSCWCRISAHASTRRRRRRTRSSMWCSPSRCRASGRWIRSGSAVRSTLYDETCRWRERL